MPVLPWVSFLSRGALFWGGVSGRLGWGGVASGVFGLGFLGAVFGCRVSPPLPQDSPSFAAQGAPSFGGSGDVRA